LLEVSRYVSYQGGAAERDALMEQAEHLLERHPAGPVFARYLTRRAGDEMMSGRAADCVATSDAAIAMANDFGLGEQAARALQYRGIARTELGDLGGLDDLRESIGRGGTALSTAIGYLNLADVTWAVVGAGEGLKLHEQTQAFCESRGVRGSYWWSKSESTWMLFDLGRWDELLAIVESVASSEAEAGGLQTLELALPYRALVLARRGDLGAARKDVDRLLPTVRASDDLQLSVPGLSVASLVAFASGDVECAVALVRELTDVARHGSDRYRSLFVAELSRLCVLAGQQELARELGTGMTVELGRIGAARTAAAAIVTEADGKAADALALYDDAARRWRAVEGLPGAAAALVGQARCLIALDRAGADLPLAQAGALFESMGDRTGLAETEELILRRRLSSR
jgi:hypothetical protein